MGLLDEAIREHLELKRTHGADEAEIARLEAEAFGPGPEQVEPDPYALDALSEDKLDAPSDRAAEAGITGDRQEPEFEWQGFGSGRLEVPDYVTGGDEGADDEGADDETRADAGEARAEARLDEERPPEVTDAPTELFDPLEAERHEAPEDAPDEPAATVVAEEAAGEEPGSVPPEEDETVLYEAPPVVGDEEPAVEDPPVKRPALEEPAAGGLPAEAHDPDDLSDGVPVDEAFVAEPRSPEGADAGDATEGLVEPLDDPPEDVEDETPLAEEEDLGGEIDLPDLAASLEPSPFARPEEPAEAFEAEPAEQPGDDSAGAEPVPPDEEAWDEVGIIEEGEPEAAPAPEDTAYLPPEERPRYEPVPDAESRPDEPLDIPPPPTEVEPVPEPELEPLAEAGDTELGPEPADAELAPEPAEAELDVPEPEIASEESDGEADPSPPRGFFEDTAEYEGIPPERRPPRDPDF